GVGQRLAPLVEPPQDAAYHAGHHHQGAQHGQRDVPLHPHARHQPQAPGVEPGPATALHAASPPCPECSASASSSSRCCTVVRRPSARSRLSLSATATDLCWPPVQPTATV